MKASLQQLARKVHIEVLPAAAALTALIFLLAR
jgi:hypothetical protein